MTALLLASVRSRLTTLTAAAALITTVTKVAFIGYEVGYAPLDYTGISGHAMFAAAVLPVSIASFFKNVSRLRGLCVYSS